MKFVFRVNIFELFKMSKFLLQSKNRIKLDKLKLEKIMKELQDKTGIRTIPSDENIRDHLVEKIQKLHVITHEERRFDSKSGSIQWLKQKPISTYEPCSMHNKSKSHKKANQHTCNANCYTLTQQRRYRRIAVNRRKELKQFQRILKQRVRSKFHDTRKNSMNVYLHKQNERSTYRSLSKRH